jgi:hypothetical protein
MSASKVKIINRVLTDLLAILKEEPAGKYLGALDDEALRQVSDVVLAMVQFETALKTFESRYLKYIRSLGESRWITSELLAQWKDEAGEADEDGDEDWDEDENEDPDESGQ